MGGDRLEYQGEVSTNTAGLTTIKLLLKSVISSILAKFTTADVKNFYLNTPMEELEYMKIPVIFVQDEIKVEYKVSEFEHDGYVNVQINKGMYGLAQVGLLENELLAKRLSKKSIQTKTTHPRPMKTPHKAHPIRTSSEQFWNQVKE